MSGLQQARICCSQCNNSAITETRMCQALPQHGKPWQLGGTVQGIISCLAHSHCTVTHTRDGKMRCYRLCITVDHKADARETSWPPSKNNNVLTHFVQQNCAYRICIEVASKKGKKGKQWKCNPPFQLFVTAKCNSSNDHAKQSVHASQDTATWTQQMNGNSRARAS